MNRGARKARGEFLRFLLGDLCGLRGERDFHGTGCAAHAGSAAVVSRVCGKGEVVLIGGHAERPDLPDPDLHGHGSEIR